MSSQSNKELLVAIATKLEPVLQQVVFVGGCTTGLLITDPGASPVRATVDVDVIVEIASDAAHRGFSQRLRQLGFSEDSTEGAPICRWVTGGMTLDVMPTDRRILGFSNRWYKPALRNACSILLDRLQLRVVTAPYFIATKLEAFYGRGNGDFYVSKDLEDIITVLDGRPTVVKEVTDSPAAVRRYIGSELSKLLADPEFLNVLPGYVLSDVTSQARIPMILETLNSLCALRSKLNRTTR